MEKFTPRTIVDFLASFEGGMNASVAPLLLDKNQIGFGLNCSIRQGFIHPRPPYQKKSLNFGGNLTLKKNVLTGLFQGGEYYRPDYGTEFLVAQISGRIFTFTENGGVWDVADVSIENDLNSATANQVWMKQAEKWMIIQDGTGKPPIFFDGVSCRRSYGASKILGVTSANFTPPSIGSTVSLTLSSDYTGDFDIPVILDGEFYQPTSNASGYVVSLKNLDMPAGTFIASGEVVVVNPNYLASVDAAAHTQGSGYLIFNGLKVSNTDGFPTPSLYPNFNPASLLTVTDVSWTSGATQHSHEELNFYYGGNVSDSSIFLQCATSTSGTMDIPANATIRLAAGSIPTYILGNTAEDFTAPAPGASFNLKLTSPYNGKNGQIVFISGKKFSISKTNILPSRNPLLVINLTDTKTTAVASGAKILSVPEIPAGRQLAYGMGCVAQALTDGISYIIGDPVGAASGTPAQNYRDAVLKITENDFLSGGGAFRLPGTGDFITAMVFPPMLDTSLGQGALQVGTQFSFFTNSVPGTDPAGWPTLRNPIQTMSLKDNGALASDSTVVVNSDTFFRSNIGIGSLFLARRNFGGWGNKPISQEIGVILDADNQTLLPYSSAQSFDNRFLCTCAPVSFSTGVFHGGIVALNFDAISSLRSDLPPAWEGLWTGLNVLKQIVGRVNGTRRSFAFTTNFDTSELELWELLAEKSPIYDDNGSVPIVWAFESPVLFNKDVKDLTELIQLRNGEIYFSDIHGKVSVKVFYRPDFYPCWTLWHQFEIDQQSDATNSQPGYRMRVGLGEPKPGDCEAVNNRQLRVGNFFQLRIEVTGFCIFKGLKASASTMPQPVFAPVECDKTIKQIIDCDPPDNYNLYRLQGVPPTPPVPKNNPTVNFSNAKVYFNQACDPGTILVYHSTLPAWITLDQANSRLIGAANTFRAETQQGADDNAQSALNDFCNAALQSGTLECFQCGATPTSLANLSWTITNPGEGNCSITKVDNTHFNWQYRMGTFSELSATASAVFCNGTAAQKTIRVSFHWNRFSGGSKQSLKVNLNEAVLCNFYTTDSQTFIFVNNGDTFGNWSYDLIVPAYSKLNLNFYCGVSIGEPGLWNRNGDYLGTMSLAEI